MEWSKVKNIIILILLMVNVILLVMVGDQDWKSKKYREEALSGAVEVLRQQGISVDADKLPEESGLAALTAERDREGEAKLAETLLGTAERTDYGGRATYTGAGGESWFRSNGTFSVAFQPGLQAAEGEEASHGAKLLSDAGYPCAVTGVAGSGGDLRVTVRQTWQGAPIFTCQAVLTYENGALTGVEGQRLIGTPTQGAAEGAPLDVATVLIRFLGGMREGGHVWTRVESLTAGYEMTVEPSGVAGLAPVWLVVTDVGPFQVDGTTGALSQVQGG